VANSYVDSKEHIQNKINIAYYDAGSNQKKVSACHNPYFRYIMQQYGQVSFGLLLHCVGIQERRY